MSALTGDRPKYKPLGICHLCARRTSLTTCEAFPNGIPVVIVTGDFDHHNRYVTDGGLQFVAKKK